MAFSEAFLSMPNSAFTWMALFLVIAVAMYFGRVPAHAVILSLTRGLYRAMRLAAASVMQAEFGSGKPIWK